MSSPQTIPSPPTDVDDLSILLSPTLLPDSLFDASTIDNLLFPTLPLSPPLPSQTDIHGWPAALPPPSTCTTASTGPASTPPASSCPVSTVPSPAPSTDAPSPSSAAAGAEAAAPCALPAHTRATSTSASTPPPRRPRSPGPFHELRGLALRKTRSRAARRWCHICAGVVTDVPHLLCDGARVKAAGGGSECRKCVCAECFERFRWDWDKACAEEGWRCSHCSGKCPKAAQCQVAGRITEEGLVKVRCAVMGKRKREEGEGTRGGCVKKGKVGGRGASVLA